MIFQLDPGVVGSSYLVSDPGGSVGNSIAFDPGVVGTYRLESDPGGVGYSYLVSDSCTVGPKDTLIH